jgi:hypothetical protein
MEPIMFMSSLRLARTAAWLIFLSGLVVMLAYSQGDEKSGFIPKDGFVPTANVARTIAEAVLSPVYGKETISSERPFKVTLEGDVWTVTGSVPCQNPPPGAVCPGGSAEVRISKKTAQILYMIHSQ